MIKIKILPLEFTVDQAGVVEVWARYEVYRDYVVINGAEVGRSRFVWLAALKAVGKACRFVQSYKKSLLTEVLLRSKNK